MQVMKFGGASLRDGPAIERVAELVLRAARAGRIALVVSAQEGVTAQLARAAEDAERGGLEAWDALRVRHRSALAQLGLASDLLDRHLFELRAILEELRAHPRRDRAMRDYVLSFGERMSARVVAAVLRRRGQAAAPLDAYDLGLTTAARRGEGTLLGAPRPGLRAELEAVPGIPVVTGYLALDPAGQLTTLGPNGSDLTAVWLGEALQAEQVVLWKAVAGFLSADPELVPEARLIPVLGRAEAVEFALHGAEVLHAGALEPAERGGIVVRVADVGEPDSPGSRIEAETPHTGALGLAHRPELALYRETLALGRDHGEQLAELFAALAEEGLEPYRASFDARELSVLVQDDERVAELVAARATRARVERGLGSLAVIGRELEGAALTARVGVLAQRAGAALVPAPGGVGARSRVFLTPAATLPATLRALHAGLFGATPAPGSAELLPQPRAARTPTA